MRAAASASSAAATAAAAAVAAAAPLPPVSVFLSHFQGPSGDAVETLKHELAQRGIDAWFDNQQPTNEAAAAAGGARTEASMMDGVVRANVFVLFMSKGVFERPFVLKELRCALQHDKPILLAHETDSRHGAFDFNVPSSLRPLTNDIESEGWQRVVELRAAVMGKIETRVRALAAGGPAPQPSKDAMVAALTALLERPPSSSGLSKDLSEYHPLHGYFQDRAREKLGEFFQPREWLRRESLDAPGDFVLIAGDPGVGKSAFVADLVTNAAAKDRVLAHHFCSTEKEATLELRPFALGLLVSLACRSDATRAAVLAKLQCDDLRALVAKAETMDHAAEILDRLLLPALGDNDVAVAARGSSATEGRLLIVVDALDEALLVRDTTTIVSLLSLYRGRFPKWVKLVATSRKDPRVLGALKVLRPSVTIDPANKEQGNQEAVEAYVVRRVQHAALEASSGRYSQLHRLFGTQVFCEHAPPSARDNNSRSLSRQTTGMATAWTRLLGRPSAAKPSAWPRRAATLQSAAARQR